MVFDAMPMPTGLHEVDKLDGAPVANVMDITGSDPDGVAPLWLSYLEVDDVEARLKAAEAAGAASLSNPFEVRGVGKIAILKYLGGDAIGWIAPSNTTSPHEADYRSDRGGHQAVGVIVRANLTFRLFNNVLSQ